MLFIIPLFTGFSVAALSHCFRLLAFGTVSELPFHAMKGTLLLGVAAYQPRRSNTVTRWIPRNRQFTAEGNPKQNYKLDVDQDVLPDLRKRSTQFGILGMALQDQSRKMRQTVQVSDVHELRKAVLDDQYPLSQVELAKQIDTSIKESIDATFLQNHAVLQLMKQRFETGSKPGHRQDNATLALAIEGGGMRGCVSAGMAAAIASLGLTDTIDRIYGSSAGSVVGAYMVSRQMCVDVYVDILPAAKKLFVCKRRLISGLVKHLADLVGSTLRLKTKRKGSAQSPPGMNISFVLDNIMGQDHGIRPLDFEKFIQNNEHQQLRIVASEVDAEGHLKTKCFGTEDFFGENVVQGADGRRGGLFACLQASMTVPAATGPPVAMTWSSELSSSLNRTSAFFDAFCFEPIPYRSAVEEGATHVLALASRPLGFQPKTKPGIYETTLAPIYFHSHNLKKVAEFFENGGQQYLYAEDIMTLKEAKMNLHDPVLVPPQKILYGLDDEHRQTIQFESEQRDRLWKKAHMIPVQVPPETSELGTLEQDKDAVLQAVRGGYSAAFDLLAPIVGLALKDISGTEAAKLMFPDLEVEDKDFHYTNLDKILLQTTVHVPGDSILNDSTDGQDTMFSDIATTGRHSLNRDMVPSHTLLSALPGFQGGRLHHLSKGLRYGRRVYLNQAESFDTMTP